MHAPQVGGYLALIAAHLFLGCPNLALRRHLFLLQLVTLRLCLGTRLGGKGFTTHSQQPHGKKGYDGEKKCAMSVNFLH